MTLKTDSSSPGGNYGKVELKDESYSVMQYMEVEMTSREAISEPKVNALTRPSLLDCLRATDYMQMLLMLHYYMLTVL